MSSIAAQPLTLSWVWAAIPDTSLLKGYSSHKKNYGQTGPDCVKKIYNSTKPTLGHPPLQRGIRSSELPVSCADTQGIRSPRQSVIREWVYPACRHPRALRSGSGEGPGWLSITFFFKSSWPCLAITYCGWNTPLTSSSLLWLNTAKRLSLELQYKRTIRAAQVQVTFLFFAVGNGQSGS